MRTTIIFFWRRCYHDVPPTIILFVPELCPHIHFNGRMVHVVVDNEVIQYIVFNIGARLLCELQGREWIRVALTLVAQCVNMVVIYVRVSNKMAKLVRDEPAMMRNKVC